MAVISKADFEMCIMFAVQHEIIPQSAFKLGLGRVHSGMWCTLTHPTLHS